MLRPSDRRGRRARRHLLAPLAALAVAALTGAAAAGDSAQDALRVCADPNNLPFSNARGEGFENQLAELVASDLGKPLAYTWWAQRRGFIRNTLNAGECDVVMGVPDLDMIATTRPYYRSTYVFVSRKDRGLDFSSIEAPELRRLRVGVHLIGDDGANTPPAHALGEQGIVDNVVGYMIYGDYRQDSPPARLIGAVERGEVDVAAVWGPLAGYFAQRSAVPLKVVPITGTEAYRPLVFQFPIAMGVRKGDQALAARLDEVIERRRDRPHGERSRTTGGRRGPGPRARGSTSTSSRAAAARRANWCTSRWSRSTRARCQCGRRSRTRSGAIPRRCSAAWSTSTR